jgi:hypothetical protein
VGKGQRGREYSMREKNRVKEQLHHKRPEWHSQRGAGFHFKGSGEPLNLWAGEVRHAWEKDA